METQAAETTKTAKERVREMLDRLPDSVTFEDIQYHLYVLKTIEKRLQSLDNGEKTYTHEEVREHFKKWLA